MGKEVKKGLIETAEEIGVNQMVQSREIHCAGCGRFLGIEAILWGVVKIKCPNCKQWNTVDISPQDG
ncbi:unnamed protein product [marine sediment metagenome]|uniref:Mu-like prophage protein Com n=1 Tax=marine sediment metagenome TaxID=412755 RepID=X1HD85_9ZZZZ